jgi:hypothetical protein
VIVCSVGTIISSSKLILREGQENALLNALNIILQIILLVPDVVTYIVWNAKRSIIAINAMDLHICLEETVCSIAKFLILLIKLLEVVNEPLKFCIIIKQKN